MEINVIDLFAGPGGLGEGFSAFRPDRRKNEFPFRIRMSVEKEASAHRTLTTRALYRALKRDSASESYFNYVEGQLSFDELRSRHSDIWKQVQAETLGRPMALGEDNVSIHERLDVLKKTHEGPWVVIGGPPCQAYSLVGRSRNRGIRGYKPKDDPRHFLYKEYLRVLEKIEPHVFIMENVKGILTAKVDDKLIFPDIVRDLEDPTLALTGTHGKTNYRIHSFVTDKESDLLDDENLAPSDFVIRAENYGVPQARHRVILLGIRSDLLRVPEILEEKPRVSIESVIDNLPKIRSRLSKEKDSAGFWIDAIRTEAERTKAHVELAISKSFAAWMNKKSKKIVPLPEKTTSYGRHGLSLPKSAGEELRKWLISDSPTSLLNHQSRSHIRSDLSRYFFSACWSEFFGEGSAKAEHFPLALKPAHKNWSSGNFSDRFRVQSKGRPSTTITSHISKDGHYFIHYDPLQCRSLTVREAARLQTFPDNYFFEGNRTQQYVQVGNAVPPFLAHQMAKAIYEILRD